MKDFKIYKISLRARITLATVIIITVIALVLTLLVMYNANYLVFSSSAAMPTQTVWIEGTNGEPAKEIEHSTTDFFAPGFSAGQAIPAQATTVTPEQASAYAVTVTPAFSSAEFLVPQEITVAVEHFNYYVLLYMLIIIVAGGLITWFVLGNALKPVRRLSEEISGISEANLALRIKEFKAGDEINSLADSFNNMLERLDKAFAGQKGFASAAAHELKTPLCAIKTNIEVLELEDKPSPKEYAQTINVIKSQTDRMVALVDELLKLAAWEKLEFETVELTPLIAQIAEETAHQLRESNVTVKINDKEGLEVFTNKELLSRVLLNVVSNAIKYGGGNVEITAKNGDTADTAEITVADNGAGIPKEYQSKIFEPFFRVDPSRARKLGGAGLGLAIAKDGVTRLGGSIEYRDREGGGSEFVVFLGDE